MDLAPIVLFVYNRVDHTMETIKALEENNLAKESTLYIYSDAAKNEKTVEKVKEVREFINSSKDGFKDVIIYEAEKNKGLGKSVIDGVTDIIKINKKVIVLEDDIITDKNFLIYMNKALEQYEKEKKIFSLSAYTPAITYDLKEEFYFAPRICSWGWGTWIDRWEFCDWDISDYKQFIKSKTQRQVFSRAGADMVDMLINQVEGKPESWAIRFDYNRYKFNDALTLYPKNSYVKNIGFDGSGEHREKSSIYDVSLQELHSNETVLPKEIIENMEMTKRFREFYKKSYKSKGAILLRRAGMLELVKKLK